MNKIEAIKLALTVLSGICWTVVYIDGIRLGFKHRSYAIPFFALALNVSWELIYTYYGFKTAISAQTVINAVWFAFDIGILVTYFKFGRRYFPWSYPSATADGTDKSAGYPAATADGTDKSAGYPSATADGTDKTTRYSSATAQGTDRSSWFIGWSILVLIVAFAFEFAFTREFRVSVAAGYSAFLQNLLMSVLFISMLVRRGNREGQSLTIAVSKWLGTLSPTILFGIVGDGGFPNGSFLILVLGLLCSVFDLVYIGMLRQAKFAAGQISSI
jgi:hypothetical protein